MRTAPITALLTLTLATLLAGGATAQDSRLPDIGSSADSVLSPAQQSQYGAMTLSQLRNLGYTLDDPLLVNWLQVMGQRLGAASDKPTQSFTFFLLGERQINAFATLGGYIGVNAGLILAAQSEDEVASVLAHEIAHVTQAHVLREVEQAQRDRIPILLAMLGAIAVAQGSGSNSSGDATMAALVSAQGLMVQRQIDYTRSKEAEADRVGIRDLARSGYDPAAMAVFFERLQSTVRRTESRESTPDYLQTHPVTTSRISEARDRARQIAETQPAFSPTRSASDNLLLPASLHVHAGSRAGDSGQFPWARERLRVLSAATPAIAVREYERIERATKLDDAQRYGLALAHYMDGHAATAITELEPLLAAHPGDVWLELALAQAQAHSGNVAAAAALFGNDPTLAAALSIWVIDITIP